jgi:hypothetical protein
MKPGAAALVPTIVVLITAAAAAASKPAGSPTAFVHRWSAPYSTFARAYSASVLACLPTSHPRCASDQLHAGALVPPVVAALGGAPPPPSLRSDVIELESGLRALEKRLVASAHRPDSNAWCRGEIGPCTAALAVVTNAITDVMNATQLMLPVPG